MKSTDQTPSWPSLLPAALAAGLFVMLLGQIGPVLGGEVVRFGFDWLPSLGIRMAFLIDGLALIFGLMVTGVGALVLLYAPYYMAGHPRAARLSLYLAAFMIAMLGLVLAGDLITLFVFWELTSVTSYLLIGFSHDRPESRRAALQAMLVTGAGGLALLAGFILIAGVTGTYDISTVLTQGDVLRDHALYLPILILILAGAFTKSAQFPFHFWLPNAMEAPTPVSAYLHSATMVKAGVYLLARLNPSLGGTDVWFWVLMIAGGTTAVMASVLAIKQTDLKQALAYTTLMALGTITLFLAIPGHYAVTAAVTFLVVHALYKAALFLLVGAIDHATGTRDLHQLGGLRKVMPYSAFAAALAGLSMAGLPPFFGWIGKELLYAGALSAPTMGWLIVLAALAANALMFAVAGIVAFRPFWGKPGSAVADHEAPWPMLAGPVVLAVCGLLAGVGAPWLAQPLVGAGVASVGGVEAAGLHLWAGINMPLVLSLATFAIGTLLYLQQGALRRLLANAGPYFDPFWDRVLDGLRALAGWQTRLVQPGLLSRYMLYTFITLLAALGVALVRRGVWPELDLGATPLLVWLITGFVVAGMLLAVFTLNRITCIAGLGTVGVGLALVFILFGAPDVAITQLMVETLVVVMFAVAALRLPRMTETRSPATRTVHGALALGVGGALSAILLGVTANPIDRRLSDYFEAVSYSDAHGLNIVNVILVDFRALDTFGEIAVVLISAVSAYALLLRMRKGEKT